MAIRTKFASNKPAMITVPEQALAPVTDAHKTAHLLGSRLGTFLEAISEGQILKEAREGKYLLAVDPKDLPTKIGWHRIFRAEELIFEPISGQEADIKFMCKGRWDEVVYINKHSVNATKEKQPIALECGQRCLMANGRPKSDAKVVVAVNIKQEPPKRISQRSQPVDKPIRQTNFIRIKIRR